MLVIFDFFFFPLALVVGFGRRFFFLLFFFFLLLVGVYVARLCFSVFSLATGLREGRNKEKRGRMVEIEVGGICNGRVDVSLWLWLSAVEQVGIGGFDWTADAATTPPTERLRTPGVCCTNSGS